MKKALTSILIIGSLFCSNVYSSSTISGNYEKTKKQKNKYLALGLSTLSPYGGLGHLYAGEWTKSLQYQPVNILSYNLLNANENPTISAISFVSLFISKGFELNNLSKIIDKKNNEAVESIHLKKKHLPSAILLSCFYPGVGHAYAGSPKRGIKYAAIEFTGAMMTTFSFHDIHPPLGTLGFVLYLGGKFFGIKDLIKVVKEKNTGIEQKEREMNQASFFPILFSPTAMSVTYYF